MPRHAPLSRQLWVMVGGIPLPFAPDGPARVGQYCRRFSESPSRDIGPLTCNYAELRGLTGRSLEKRPDLVGRVTAVSAGGADRRDATLAGPVGDGPLRHLEQQRDLAGAKETALEAGRLAV